MYMPGTLTGVVVTVTGINIILFKKQVKTKLRYNHVSVEKKLTTADSIQAVYWKKSAKLKLP